VDKGESDAQRRATHEDGGRWKLHARRPLRLTDCGSLPACGTTPSSTAMCSVPTVIYKKAYQATGSARQIVLESCAAVRGIVDHQATELRD
jgi:hypothetical protein